MRRSHALLVAILCALSLPARGQALVFIVRCDHDWSIHYGTNRYGLDQESSIYYSDPPLSNTSTRIWFGSRQFSVNHTIWVVTAVIALPFICLGWLCYYGFGSVFRADKKPPPPNPSPPP